METAHNELSQLLSQISGYIYPNEIEVHWSILIVVYPYLTGLVAGAFILASLVKVFNITELKPTYRLSLITALSFLLIAPLPLLLHLGHPLRSFEIFLTPNLSSAMAMFGFVYAWYLMVVLLLEIWFDYRVDMINFAKTAKFPMNWFYKVISLFSTDTSPHAIAIDKKVIKFITIIGIPSAFILHGYVGFIFGSIKANPWWSSVLIPIVFLFSAIVSGIALILLLYMIITPSRGIPIDMKCLDKIASFLLYAVIIDFSLEILDFIHRLYESEESIKILTEMVMNKLFISLVVLQVLIGMIVPLSILIIIKLTGFNQELRKLLYFLSAILIQIGIFSTRWNVVLGGQMFSKSLRGLTTYKLEIMGIEGFLSALVLLILPFFILALLIKILPPWKKTEELPI
ncbi:MAG: polysulfide reductase NrfD [Candidatus Marinimicrobia bacterium]|nr:polysulfide reductase NrfD [Candidatus Neomarinimicrobiota bacterium]MBT4731633.1 polysulfide reductase NrfD [Candidatus Woesearchaeota archaeon]MBT3634318.1 polysulfide reductase NrfD [Candidatus Neomarinimicrobiota bacterium]MBT3681773.1 polysulfide reductase NrfD [Candidatus Neomarinimicrobiota bacterium]MBT3760769.1 polysulfide reductase NrfD [Candidatus Neomarinimicrobiota bacterium]